MPTGSKRIISAITGSLARGLTQPTRPRQFEALAAPASKPSAGAAAVDRPAAAAPRMKERRPKTPEAEQNESFPMGTLPASKIVYRHAMVGEMPQPPLSL